MRILCFFLQRLRPWDINFFKVWIGLLFFFFVHIKTKETSCYIMSKSKWVAFPTFWFCLHHPSAHLVGIIPTVPERDSDPLVLNSVDSPRMNCQSSTPFHFRFTMWWIGYHFEGICVINVSYKCKFFINIYETYSRCRIYYTCLVYVWWFAPYSR